MTIMDRPKRTSATRHSSGPAHVVRVKLNAAWEDAWRAHAACIGSTELFYPGRGEDQDGRAARQVCWGQCPVRSECLRFAIVTNQDDGVWGGHSERSRRNIRTQYLRTGEVVDPGRGTQ